MGNSSASTTAANADNDSGLWNLWVENSACSRATNVSDPINEGLVKTSSRA